MTQSELEKQIIQALRESGSPEETCERTEAGMSELKRFTATDILGIIQEWEREHKTDEMLLESLKQRIARTYSY